MALTPSQKAILDFISDFTEKHGFAPSQPEIAKRFKFSSLGTVHKYISRLKDQGFLENTPNSRRGLTVAKSKPPLDSSTLLPILGRVAAGKPIEAFESHGTIGVPSALMKHGEHFVLEVMGNSMIEDGILHGDFVVVRKQKTANQGQLVVALVDDSATVKRFHPKKNHIELHPANPEYKPIIVSPEQSFHIEGIVSGVIRKVS